MTRVFTQEWVKQTIKKYKHLRSYQQPLIYHLAATDKGRIRLEQIEAWAAELPEDALSKMIPKLQDERNHQHTYHELAIGHFLKELGFHVEYEKEFKGFPGRNPDWYARADENTPAFIVEVFTDNVSQKPKEERLQNDAIADLCYRIEQIKSDLAVYVHVRRDATLAIRENKLLIPLIERWLLDEQPSLSSERTFGDVRVLVAHRSAEYPHTVAMPLAEAFMVDKEPLRTKIEKVKVDHYKDLSIALALPLVICVVPTFITARSLDTLADVLYGQEAIQYFIETVTGNVVGHRLIRQADGLFAELPKLSGIIWFEPGTFGAYEAQFVPNPNALLPLPPDLLGDPSDAADMYWE